MCTQHVALLKSMCINGIFSQEEWHLWPTDPEDMQMLSGSCQHESSAATGGTGIGSSAYSPASSGGESIDLQEGGCSPVTDCAASGMCVPCSCSL